MDLNPIVYQFTNVVNAVTEKCSQSEEERLLGPLFLGINVQRASEELQSATIEVAVLSNSTIILRSEQEVFAMDGRHIAGLFEHLFQILDDLLGCFQVLKVLQTILALQHFAEPDGFLANLHLLLQLLQEFIGFLFISDVIHNDGNDLDQTIWIDSLNGNTVHSSGISDKKFKTLAKYLLGLK